MSVPSRVSLRVCVGLALSVWAVGCGSKSASPGSGQGSAGAADAASGGSSVAASGGRFAIVGGERVEAPSIPMGDEATIAAILDEGQRRNEVMDHLVYLTSNFGARLTASASLEAANRWSAERFEAWGLSNVQLAQWGEAQLRFDRGPSSGRAFADDSEEADRDFEFTTLAWTMGTDGPARGRVVKYPESWSDASSDRYAGAWVLMSPEPQGRQGIRGITGQMAARTRVREAVHEAIAAGPEQITPDNLDMFKAFGGVWKGTILGPGIPEGGQVFEVHLSIGPSGEPRLEAGVPELTMAPIEDLVFAGNEASFTTTLPRGPFTYRLALGEGQLGGFGRFAGAGYQINLTRESEVSTGDVEDWWDYYTLRGVLEAGPLGFISSSNDERVWTSSPVRGDDLLALTMDDVARDIEVNVRMSDYDYLNSRLADGRAVEAEFDLSHSLQAGPIPLYNTIAEIPGTEFPEEVVIVSAHLDSWNGPGSTGTVDNGTGSSVTLEAARILAAVGAKPKRTIRFILWTGEEQGLMGSRAYVASLSEEELENISAVFVDDGGTNSEGGLPAADFMVDYLAAATAPTNGVFTSPEHAAWARTDDDAWNDDGYINVNVRPTGEKIQTHGGSDHAPFNAVGVPGFFWDEVGRANYWEAWHTQNDTIDQAVPEYLMQSATNAAITAYNLACAPSLLPRTGESSGAAEDADAIETQIGTRR